MGLVHGVGGSTSIFSCGLVGECFGCHASCFCRGVDGHRGGDAFCGNLSIVFRGFSAPYGFFAFVRLCSWSRALVATPIISVCLIMDSDSPPALVDLLIRMW